MSLKQKAFRAMSPYIRLRDAIAYHKENRFDISGLDPESLLVACCSCGKVRPWKSMDAGHFISRSSGGSSGVYLDERNVHAQCRSCNRFKEGNKVEYYNFMLKKYGQNIVDELRALDNKTYTKKEIEGLKIYYKQQYKVILENI